VESAQKGNWSKVGEGGIRRGKGERGREENLRWREEPGRSLEGGRGKVGKGTGNAIPLFMQYPFE